MSNLHAQIIESVSLFEEINNLILANSSNLKRFDSWLKTSKYYKKTLQSSRLYDLFRSLEKAAKEFEEKGTVSFGRGELEKGIREIGRFEPAGRAYVRYLESLPEVETPVSKGAFSNMRPGVQDRLLPVGDWFFYFLFISEINHKLPKIARTILKIKENKKVRLENVAEAFSGDYEGTYRYIDGSNVVLFDLADPIDESNPQALINRHLHFKIDYPPIPHDILFGTYTTYDGNKVYSGSMLLQRVNAASSIHGTNPMTICQKTNPEDFFKIDESIQQFLSQKIRNYYLVPRPRRDLDHLKEFLKGASPLRHKDSRFFDHEIPHMFIATPQTGGNVSQKFQNRLKVLLDDVKSELLNKVEVYHWPETKVSEMGSESVKNLIDLKRTKYFVLIIDGINKASFSLVQLGISLIYSAHILVIHKEGSLSHRFHAIENLEFKKQPYKDLISKEDYETVRNRIISFVKDNT